jgi:hypothetical protein
VVEYPNRTVGYWSTSDIDYAMIGAGDSTMIQTLAQRLGAGG